MPEGDFPELVSVAATGDQQAWTLLVGRLWPVALKVAHAYRLGDADTGDVCQATCLALAQQLNSLRDATRLPGWVATTARRQAVKMLAARAREATLTCENLVVRPSPESLVLAAERDRELWAAARAFPELHRRLLWLLAHRPELTQTEIAAELGIRPGSVGPLRRRCLDRLRRHLTSAGFTYP
jgi:RNA polymerase sigma factor (sigma-70 family)